MRYAIRVFTATALLFAPVAFAGSLGNLVVAGDSLSAGYQNNQLIDCTQPPLTPIGNPCVPGKPNGQPFGYANVIARQAGVSLNLPSVPPPGFPQITTIDGFAVAGSFNTAPLDSVAQVLASDPSLDPSVPGFTVAALVGYTVCPPGSGDPSVPLPIQAMALAIVNPGCTTPATTELQEAAYLANKYPGTSILWIGSNDALFPLLFNGQTATDPLTFAKLYDVAVNAMRASSKQLVLANIPDVTLLPYLTSVPKLAAILNLPVRQVESALGLHDGDMVTPYAFAVLFPAPGQVNLAPLPPFITVQGAEDPVVIRAAQIRSLRQSVLIYNAIIAIEAALHHAVLVDVHGLVDEVSERGVVANGQRLTTDFMGGLFSLDGVHPSNTGYAVIANEFIRTMNQRLGTSIPRADINAVAATDPMVFPPSSTGHHNQHVDCARADLLRDLMRRH